MSDIAPEAWGFPSVVDISGHLCPPLALKDQFPAVLMNVNGGPPGFLCLEFSPLSLPCQNTPLRVDRSLSFGWSLWPFYRACGSQTELPSRLTVCMLLTNIALGKAEANTAWEAAGTAQGHGCLHPHGRSGGSPWHLASFWPSPSSCHHLGSEPVGTRSLSLSGMHIQIY